MLNEIPNLSPPTDILQRFLHVLDIGGFVGDISTKRCDRVVAATDNSIWQRTPTAVLSPKNHDSVAFALKLLGRNEFRSIAITPRGAGTSTAGQTLTSSIILDCKRHLHEIQNFDEGSKRVTVECGAVLDSVNLALVDHGVMLGPTVATASRATIGGMIGNDSAGKGSSVYGKMSDCIVELRTALLGGSTIQTSMISTEEIQHLEDSGEFQGLLYGEVQRACERAQPHLEKHWPVLPRFISGYNLPMALDSQMLHLNRILCGSEGTLGVTTSALLQCVDIPKHRQLLLLCFDSFDKALTTGVSLTTFEPSAIETVDDMVIEAARHDRSWSEIAPLLGSCKDDVRAILFVEFSGEHSKIEQALAFTNEHGKIIHATILTDKAEIQSAWTFRSRSVGLLSSITGNKKPIPFVEDCAVPPESLSPFIRDFQALLSNYTLRAGMFGHVDAGVIHIRPAMNMETPTDRDLVQTVTKEVAALVQSYGGILWGEHGKGFRSEFGPIVFGDAIWEQMCAIKKAFDPNNQLNPGKVALPEVSMPLAGLNEPTRGEHDASISSLPQLDQVKQCDGNSECQSSLFSDNMCPTYRATRDPKHSPRGRSELIRSWIKDVDSDQLTSGTFFQKIQASSSNDDFSHEVYETLEGCLSCKACATHCPMHIDIPTLRSEFYALYFSRYFRPIRDHVWFNMESILPFLASPLGKLLPTKLLGSLIGIVDAPKANRTHRLHSCSPFEAIKNNASVAILQDSYTTYFRSNVLTSLYKILAHLGHNVAVLDCRPNGKAFHVRGNTNRFQSVAMNNTDWLDPLQGAHIPIVGIDPAATLLWRDEYKSATSKIIQVLLPQEFLVEQDLSSIHCSGTWELLPHCIENSLAPQSKMQWKQIFKSIGASLELKQAACCGMGGMFGHQQEFKEQSIHIWNQNWAPHIHRDKKTLVTGFSCASQAKRIENVNLIHPLEVISSQM